MKTLICFLIMSGCVYGQNLQRIPLKVSDAYQTNFTRQDVTHLIDDDHNTRFNPGYNLIILPHNVVFDLSDYAPCTITRLVIWDGAGNNYNCRLVLVNAESGKEDTVYTFRGDQYNKSDTIDLPVSKQMVASKFILRSATGGDGYPEDLQVWGIYTPHAEQVWQRPGIPIKNGMGVVAHPWDIDFVSYPAKYLALKNLNVSGIRVYSDAYVNKDISGNYILNPDSRGFQTEATFARLKSEKAAFLTQVCYQNQDLSVKQTWPSNKFSQLNFEYQYYYLRDSVFSYQTIAKDMFVLATRGGSNQNLPDYPVYQTSYWWEQKQQMVKGQGFYDVIEGGNEWNAWWNTSLDTYMGGAHLGAAWSMMYDGHKGRYVNSGVKQADPNLRFTNGGIASDQPDIFREMVEWSKRNRGYLPDGSVDIPLDLYSYHSYSSVDGQYGNSKGGIPPEIGMIPQARNMVYFSNKYGGGKPVVIGEWGWDVHPNSPLNAPSYAGHTAEQIRAWWAVRGILKFSEVGIYHAQWYRAFQDYPNSTSDANGEQFATMALLRQMDDAGNVIRRTLVGDYFTQLSSYGDYVFEEATRTDSLNVLKFRKDTSYIWAVWAVEQVQTPHDGRPVFSERSGTYILQVPMNAILRTMNFSDDGSGQMLSTWDMAVGTNFTIQYSAKPVIIEMMGVGGVLAAQLVSFDALGLENSVRLNWHVDRENMLVYTIERSTDGIHFSRLTSLNAIGKSVYQVIDGTPLVGKNFYRLKMTDKNGSTKYSSVKLVTFQGKTLRYTAYNYLGQKLAEGNDFYRVDREAGMLRQGKPYIIKGSDGRVVKLLKQ